MCQMGTFFVLRRAHIVMDRRTKHLCRRIQPGQFAVIDHPDVDEMAAAALVEAGVSAVINTSPFLTGFYPALGTQRLLLAGIPLYHADQPLFEQASKTNTGTYEGEEAVIAGNQLLVRNVQKWMKCSSLEPVTQEQVQMLMEKARSQTDEVLCQFLDNTLAYANREKELLLKPLPKIPLLTRMSNRHVVAIGRGKHCREDLLLLDAYIRKNRPVLMAVDGGADVLLAAGFVPDLIVGDMDSLTDQALQCGAEVVVHAYMDGYSPGKTRVEALGVPYVLLPSPGTSEDVALLLAFEENAELIVTIGTHSTMIDFLEKGRKGMASTLLVRAKIGSKLIDAKGVSQLFVPRALSLVQSFRQNRFFESLYLMVKGWRAHREQSEHRDSGI